MVTGLPGYFQVFFDLAEGVLGFRRCYEPPCRASDIESTSFGGVPAPDAQALRNFRLSDEHGWCLSGLHTAIFDLRPLRLRAHYIHSIHWAFILARGLFYSPIQRQTTKGGRTVRTSNSRHGFTLIELLVVISVSPSWQLLPAVTAMREKGQRVQCASNQKQIITMMIAYVIQAAARLSVVRRMSPLQLVRIKSGLRNH